MATAKQVIDALWRANRGTQIYRDLPRDLRRTHLYVLYALEELGGVARVTDIAKKTLVKVPNLTKLLRETEAAGWTKRSPDRVDGRTVLIHLTEAGASSLNEYYHDYVGAIAEALRAEDHPEYDVMIAAIDRATTVIREVTHSLNSTTVTDESQERTGPKG